MSSTFTQFTSAELRKKYIDFFNKNNHSQVVSASVIPDSNDQTVLFTTAGMQQFVPNLMGKPHPQGDRLSSVQKCVRTVDIDEVGDNRHLTFFEMLGNWSLGDYFKKESIKWSYQFLIDELKIPKEKLWVTVYGGDEKLPYDQESHDIWLEMGIPEYKIIGIGAPTDPEKRRRKGRGDNFWAAGATGPCGPSSELFIWLGEGEPKEGQNPETDEDNFIEVWNNVFMAYEQMEGGELKALSQKNVDTGMGLERLTMIIQEKTTVFETDVYNGIIAEIEKLSGKKYPPYSGDINEKNEITRAFRVIADHVRCATHLIADGVSASNEGRGYVLRRLLRRAIRFGKLLGIQNFLSLVSSVYSEEFSEFYPEIGERKKVVTDALHIEEENFLRTLEKGEKKLSEIINDIKKNNQSNFSGVSAFVLSDTYGFPKDLTREIVEEKGFEIDEEVFNAEFEAELKAQRERSRSAGKFEMKGGDNSVFENLPATEFVGDTGENIVDFDAEILAFVDDGEGKMRVAFAKTPFYAESGGQVGDRGTISVGEKQGRIVDTKKISGVNGDVFIHFISAPHCVGCACLSTDMRGKIAKVSVDVELRRRTTRHHSAAHLLQSALLSVLGDGIEQAGSLVDEKRTRFDFSYPKALTKKEVQKVEEKITEYVQSAYPVSVISMSIDEAKQAGAVALFSEKYGNVVRTVRMGEPSFELCGGTHVQNTAEIGGVKILSESSCSSGIRRIEMVVGEVAQAYFIEKCTTLSAIADVLKSSEIQVEERVEKMLQEKKVLQNEVGALEKKLLGFEALEFYERKKEINGKSVICEPIPTHDLKHVAGIARALSDKAVDCVVLFTEDGGIVVATQKGGVNARDLFEKIKEISGGNGGGSPFFLQGKGVNLERFPEIREVIEGSM